jgi:nucleoside-specific outer membrane channel protein Tsx
MDILGLVIFLSLVIFLVINYMSNKKERKIKDEQYQSIYKRYSLRQLKDEYDELAYVDEPFMGSNKTIDKWDNEEIESRLRIVSKIISFKEK